MKQIFLTLLCLLTINIGKAQVGINTTNPEALLHIDGASTAATTNPTSGRASDIQAGDDVVITKEGNVGLGTISPATKLEIKTAGTRDTPIEGFTLIDGNESAGKVLTSDARGKATWRSPGFSEFRNLSGYQTAQLNYSVGGTIIYTGYSITFPSAGTYLITIGLSIVDSNLFSIAKSYIVQLMPTNNPNNWNSTTERYIGSYEAYAIPPGKDARGRIYFSQALTIPPNRLTAYMMFAHNGATVAGNMTIYLGENAYAGCPQCTGGSYVRIN